MESLSFSEPSAEKAKIKVSLDPFEWIHSDVHELIFQHFDPEDSLRASLVSQTWNKSTEASKKCWEKLEVQITDDKILEINRPIAEDFKSFRKYQKLFLFDIDDIGGLISVIRKRKWKRVEMINCELVQLKEILKIVEPTIEMLHIQLSTFSSSSNNSSETSNALMKYPMLKDLKLCNSEGLPLKDVTGDCKTLEKIELNVVSWDPATNDDSFLSSFNTVLENSPKLEELSYKVFNALHDGAAPFPIHSTLNHRFKLKNLSFHSNSGWHDPENRILSFLKSQVNTLEELSLEPCTGLETLKTILKMPKLIKFHFHLDDEPIADWNNIHLNQNHAVKDFTLWFIFELNENVTEFLGKIFQSMPNCQQLYVTRLNGEALQSLAQQCPKIKKLDSGYVVVDHIDELPDLPAIEAFECTRRINEALQTQIRAKPEEARTRLEKLILQNSDKDCYFPANSNVSSEDSDSDSDNI